MKDKKYELPESVDLLNDKYAAADKLKNIAIKTPFGFWKARKCAREAEYFRRKFWRKVRELYPELDKEGLSYNSSTGLLEILKSDEV
jgi:hypothetical protein